MSTVQDEVPGVPSDEPDAVCRGWWAADGGARDTALFMLAGTAMGVSRTDTASGEMLPPEWVDLATVVHLDALGDPVAGLQEVELGVSTGAVWQAGWTDPFCDAVVGTLQALVAAYPDGVPPPQPQVVPAPVPTHLPEPLTEPAPAPTPPPTASPFAPDPGAPAAELVPLPEPSATFPPAADPVPPVVVPGAPPVPVPGPLVGDRAAGRSSDDLPVGVPGDQDAATPPAAGASLVLEDVVYLGGHPSESKKKKRCTATMTGTGTVVEGPGGMSLDVPWADVASVEAQNSDEARFRINLRIHRDATAVVLTCADGARVLLEARDCPTIPLRSAIAQLLADLPVEVV